MVKTNKENTKISEKMSIQVSLDGFSFCALDKKEREILYFHEEDFSQRLNPVEVLERIEQLYMQEPFLETKQGEVELLFANELYTLVPKRFHKEENASDFLKFNTKILQTDVLSQDYVGEELVNIFIPYTNIVNFFFEHYGEFQYRHSVSVLAEGLLGHSKDETGTSFYVNRHTTGFDLIVIENQKLLLTNSFHCESKEDFLYYLLFTAEQLDQNPEEFDLVLFGKITKTSEFYQIAYSYIRNIRLLDISFGFRFPGSGPPPKGYQHYALFNSLR